MYFPSLNLPFPRFFLTSVANPPSPRTISLEEAKARFRRSFALSTIDPTAKEEIRETLRHSAIQGRELDAWLQEISKEMVHQNPIQAMKWIQELIPLEAILSALQSRENRPFTTVEALAQDHVREGLPYPDHSLKRAMESEWKKYRSICIHFIPNLLNIFLGAFNFLDAQKKFTTLWEKHLLLDIIYKFFVIPLALIQMLQPIFVIPAKVYLVAAVTLAACGALLASYQRWLKPLPSEIVNCTNLDKQLERGVIELKLGSREEMSTLIAKLQVYDHVVLRGASGEGKTALVHHYLQLKERGELPDRLNNQVAFEADCGTLICSQTFGHSELINQIKEQISGFEERVLLFFDDFYQLATHKEAFLTFKKRLLEDRPYCKSILAVTPKEWEAIVALDTDYSFRRRVCVIDIKEASDEQTLAVLSQDALQAKESLITQEAISRAVELSKEETFLPLVGRLAKAKLIFKEAIARSREAFLFPSHHPSQKENLEKLARRMEDREKLKDSYSQLSYQLSKKAKEGSQKLFYASISPKLEQEKSAYLWYCFYGKEALEKLIASQVALIPATLPVKVDEHLVYEVYKTLKREGGGA